MIVKNRIATFLLLVNIWMGHGSEDLSPKKNAQEQMEERALKVGMSLEDIKNTEQFALPLIVGQMEAEQKELDDEWIDCQQNLYARQWSDSTACTDTQNSPMRNCDNNGLSPFHWENYQYSPDNVSQDNQYFPQNYGNSQLNYDEYQQQQCCTDLQYEYFQSYYPFTMDSNGYVPQSQNYDPYANQLNQQNSNQAYRHFVNYGSKIGETSLIPSTKTNWKTLKHSSRLIIMSYLDEASKENMVELVLRNPYFRRMFAKTFPTDLDENISERAHRLSKFYAYTLQKQENTYSFVDSRLMDMFRKEPAALDFCSAFEDFFVWSEEHMMHVLGESLNRKIHSLTDYYQHSFTFKLDSKTHIELQRSFVRVRKEGRDIIGGYCKLQSFKEILLSFSFDGNYFVLFGSDFTEDGTEVRLQYRSTRSTYSFVFLYPQRNEKYVFVRKNRRFYYFEKVDTVMMLFKTSMTETQEMKLTPAEFEQNAASFEYLTSQNFEKLKFSL